MWGYNTAASLISALLFETFIWTCLLLTNKTLNFRLHSILYNHLQHCTIHSHIVLSYQYNHCEATSTTTQQLHWYLPWFLRISILLTCFLFLNRTLNFRLHWDYAQSCIIILSTIQSILTLFSHISITIVRLQVLQHSSFVDICLTFWEIQCAMLAPHQ